MGEGCQPEWDGAGHLRTRRGQGAIAALADNLPNGAIYRLELKEDRQFALTYISAGIFSLIGVQATEIVADQQLFLQANEEEDFVPIPGDAGSIPSRLGMCSIVSFG